MNYPVIAIPDLHGQRRALERLLARLEALPEWPACAVVFLGDFVDRGPDVRGTLDLVLGLLGERPKRTAVMGNHDMAVVRAARLDNGPASGAWSDGYRDRYDHVPTFEFYLGRAPDHGDWEGELNRLREAIPVAHRRFLASLPWLEVDHVRIRLDTSGGHGGPLTACLLHSAHAEPCFIQGSG